MLSICVYFSNIVHFYIAVLFINVILGLDPRIQVNGVVRECGLFHCSLLSIFLLLQSGKSLL